MINDVTMLLPLVEGFEDRIEKLYADRGYDSDPLRLEHLLRGVCPRLGRRKTAHGSGLGRQRWVVERSLCWLHQFRRLRTRFERRADIHQAFLTLACAMICWRTLNSFSQTLLGNWTWKYSLRN
jgi:transposase